VKRHPVKKMETAVCKAPGMPRRGFKTAECRTN
jgi:hypothetical protein